MKSQIEKTKKISKRQSHTQVMSYILTGALAAATVLSGCATTSSGSQTGQVRQEEQTQSAAETISTADSSDQAAAEDKTADSSGSSAIGSRQMVIKDGMAQQIVHYTNAQDPAYTNVGSEILRFVVYVETDHDTDLDGKPDLIKTMVQLPRPAAEGAYKAPVIYEARPYNAGIYAYHPDLEEVKTPASDKDNSKEDSKANSKATFEETSSDESFDESKLKTQPEKRTPSGTMDTLELASGATPADWYYNLDRDDFGLDFMENFTTYDDLLVCGYAVVQSAGLGTWGSEGIEACGSELEADAFKCVVEWLTGRRNAYTDTDNNIAVSADWSSGNIGMTGRSYSGAMAFEVASTGVEGLKTIVPVAGPSCWYAYTNSQGVNNGLYDSYGALKDLAIMCASRFAKNAVPITGSPEDYDEEAATAATAAEEEAAEETAAAVPAQGSEEDTAAPPAGESADKIPGTALGTDLETMYISYLSYLRDQEIALAGDYGPFWEDRDFTRKTGFKTPALIVHGLNDITVHPDQFDRMRTALLNTGCEVKTLLHQNGHVTPANDRTQTDIMIGDHTYTEWLNLWFTHYLLDVDNEAADLPSLLVQSNVDGTFHSREEWTSGAEWDAKTAETPVTIDNTSKKDTSGTGSDESSTEYTISAAGAHLYNPDLIESTFDGKSGADHLCWSMDVTEPVTISGVTRVHIRAKTSDTDRDAVRMGAVLVDHAEEPFETYARAGDEVLEPSTIRENGVYRGEGLRPYDLVEWKTTPQDRKIIAFGMMDLLNPEAGYVPATAVKRETPIEKDRWYDYDLYLQPNYYTVQPGHTLELYIVPFCGFSNDSAFYDTSTEDELLELGFDPASMVAVKRDYSFTVDQSRSHADLPVTK